MHDAGRSEEVLGLLRAARRGDSRAFEALVRSQIERVYSVLFRVVGSHEDAEDLAQEVFVRLFESLDRFREEGSFEGWLFRIALRIGLDHQRRRGRGLAFVELDTASIGAFAFERPESECSRRELLRQLRAAIDRLPPKLRIALVLRVLEGLEYSEIAAATGLRPGTVRTQVMKARRLLARWLAPFLEGGHDDE